MFLVVEGLDGTGKSTLVNRLSDELSLAKLATPSGQYKEVRGTLDSIYSKNSLARQLFYASTVVQLTDEVRHQRSKGNSVIVDRYWLSTQVYHNWKCDGHAFELKEVEEYVIAPDVTIYLSLPHSERKARILGRSDNTDQDNLTLDRKVEATLQSFYHSYKESPVVGRWLEVDASLPINDIVSFVKEYLKETV